MKKDINRDIIKHDAAKRREEDIAAHGKPTAFRKTMTKNPKAYSRKEKHKVQLAGHDIEEMVERCVEKIIKEWRELSASEKEWRDIEQKREDERLAKEWDDQTRKSMMAKKWFNDVGDNGQRLGKK